MEKTEMTEKPKTAEEPKAMLTEIERASTHDGYGIRTVVFFKGCPLHCAWCHNPECIERAPQTLFYPEKCPGCGKCGEGCFAGAREKCGKEYTRKEVLREILRDKDYYGKDGGVTFSGGEPLMQKEFLSGLLDLCREHGVGTSVETSLFLYDEEIFKKLDFVMADLKIWDSDLHRKYTGVGNEEIKENFRRLSLLGIPVIARTPVIPGVEQGIDRIAAFLSSLGNVREYELLPYHPLGKSKRRALGMEDDGFEVTEDWKKEVAVLKKNYEF